MQTADQSPRSDPEIPHIHDGVPPPSSSQGHDRVRKRERGDTDKRERTGPWGPISTLTVTELPELIRAAGKKGENLAPHLRWRGGGFNQHEEAFPVVAECGS